MVYLYNVCMSSMQRKDKNYFSVLYGKRRERVGYYFSVIYGKRRERWVQRHREREVNLLVQVLR